ncbi:PIR Superfamily Protein [Plasmodium ovale wallikeri]|uniref:PIR Superfamily Protein n=1 Tax=Plasmodium ovale wallikeri TaxID=864142 RepID=A0A1A9AK36_PLAOA|nr:PIR Superfamily Protein [Plasmodium ovale wallikeri]
MTMRIRIDDIPSKKYNNELKNGINYNDIDKNIQSTKFSPEDSFWSMKMKEYLENYVNNNVDKWKDSNEMKRCRDLNHILNSIIKKIKTKKNYSTSYDLIEEYTNNAARMSLQIHDTSCTRDSKLPEHSDDIENAKKIDDLCEDVAYIEEKISEIHSNDCTEIQNYLDKQIAVLKSIYTTSEEKYTHILGYYDFTSFDKIDNIVNDFKSKCQEGTTGASLVGDQGGTQPYSGRSTSIIAVTSLSGILSSFFLLYKTTSFGSILNNLVGKKIKFGNNLSDEAYHETLEDISEPSHDGGYNILYNSIGDTQ